MEFQTFFVDTNQVTGLVKSIDDWKKIVQMLKKAWGDDVTAESIMKKIKLFEANTLEVEIFGLYSEHTGISLAKWAKKNGVYDILKNV